MRFSSDTSNACSDNRLKEVENHLECKCDKKFFGQGSVLEEPELQIIISLLWNFWPDPNDILYSLCVKKNRNFSCLYKWDLETLGLIVSWNQVSLFKRAFGVLFRLSSLEHVEEALLGCCIHAFSESVRILLGEERHWEDSQVWWEAMKYWERSGWGFDPDSAELYQWLTVCPWTSCLIFLGQLTSPNSLNDMFFIALFSR